MTDNQEETLGQARKEIVQAKLLKDVIDVLKDNREALCHLPEMFEQLLEMPEAIPKVEKATDTLDECRSEEDRTILARREKEDLVKKVKYLSDDNSLKAERIQTLEKTIEDHKAEMLAVRNTQSANMSKDERFLEKEENLKKFSKTLQDRNDDLIRDIGTKEAELKDQAERTSSLEKELQAMEERKVQMEVKFDQLKELYNTTVSSKEREIEQLKNRLASLSEKRVKQDQSKVEDTLSLNR